MCNFVGEFQPKLEGWRKPEEKNEENRQETKAVNRINK